MDNNIHTKVQVLTEMMEFIKVDKEKAGRSDAGRLLALAYTNLEIAKLYLKEIAYLEAEPKGTPFEFSDKEQSNGR